MKFFNRRSSSQATLVFIAGEGGHLEQANRILASLDPAVRSNCHCLLISDTQTLTNAPFDECWTVDTCAPKYRSLRLTDLWAYLKSSSRVLYRLARQHEVRMAIVTGPGFAMIPALGAKILGAHLIVFESWSRFEKRSKCGQVLYRPADQFYVQHKELLTLYPKATWVGLL